MRASAAVLIGIICLTLLVGLTSAQRAEHHKTLKARWTFAAQQHQEMNVRCDALCAEQNLQCDYLWSRRKGSPDTWACVVPPSLIQGGE
jgi:hypothetical protein